MKVNNYGTDYAKSRSGRNSGWKLILLSDNSDVSGTRFPAQGLLIREGVGQEFGGDIDNRDDAFVGHACRTNDP